VYSLGGMTHLLADSGTYTVGVYFPGVHNLTLLSDTNDLGLLKITPYVGYNFQPVPGIRYISLGACSIPVTTQTYPVTVSGAAGTTFAGPTLTLDDSCSYEGVYGTITYSGSKSTMGLCRRLNVDVYSDPGYTTLLPYSQSFYLNASAYNFVTNLASGMTGLAPVYIRAWYDADGSNSFSTGDPYLQVGPVSPTDNGTHQNLSFGDTYVK